MAERLTKSDRSLRKREECRRHYTAPVFSIAAARTFCRCSPSADQKMRNWSKGWKNPTTSALCTTTTSPHFQLEKPDEREVLIAEWLVMAHWLKKRSYRLFQIDQHFHTLSALCLKHFLPMDPPRWRASADRRSPWWTWCANQKTGRWYCVGIDVEQSEIRLRRNKV